MKSEKTKQALKITFHNPNTPEETADFLMKIIARNIADNLIEQKALSGSVESLAG